jgi:hypothetical protein
LLLIPFRPNERDACGRVRRRAGKADAADWNKQKAGSKTAVDEEHGGMLLVSQIIADAGRKLSERSGK